MFGQFRNVPHRWIIGAGVQQIGEKNEFRIFARFEHRGQTMNNRAVHFQNAVFRTRFENFVRLLRLFSDLKKSQIVVISTETNKRIYVGRINSK